MQRPENRNGAHECQEDLTCLDQEKVMSQLWISICVRKREVKCFRRVKKLLFSAEGEALGDIAN
jgi:hypothetical protein